MAIITFWSPTKKQTNQTSSILASSLQMAIDRNLKILVVDASFSSDDMKSAFNTEEKAKKSWFGFGVSNLGKVDVSAGIESLLSAVASNKTSPEIINSYTVPLLAGRLDILYGLKTMDISVFENSLDNFSDMLNIANQYYDLVYVDLEKNSDAKGINRILKMSDIIVYPFEQRPKQIETFVEKWGNVEPFENKLRVIPLLTKEDRFSKYNSDNLGRRLKIKEGVPSIIYNTLFMEALQEGKLMQLFFNLNNQLVTYRNNYFIQTIMDFNSLLLQRIQELQYIIR